MDVSAGLQTSEQQQQQRSGDSNEARSHLDEKQLFCSQNQQRLQKTPSLVRHIPQNWL